MLSSLRPWLLKALASPAPDLALTRSASERWLTLLVATALGLWVFAYKLLTFLGLETTSDAYAVVQLTTTWLDGNFLYDNFFGNQLATHTFLLAPLLAVLTWPFGVVGLFMFLGLSVAFSLIALVKIARLLGVPRDLALLYALIATAMPLAVHVYQDTIYGFHLELLEPALALWLTYFLLRRHWLGSLVLATALILVKEDAPLLVIVVAVLVLCEDFLRSLGQAARARWNSPALVALGLAVLSVPLLLLLLKSQQVAGTPTNLSRIQPLEPGAIASNTGLVTYVLSHLGTWLRSPVVVEWLGLAWIATVGLVVLRPHLLLVGVLTTLICWLARDLLLWSPRFAPAFAFFQIVGCLALTSLWQLCQDARASHRVGRLLAPAALTLAGLLALHCLHRQHARLPATTELYRLIPVHSMSRADRQRADQLFAIYRRDSRRAEPVIASDYLFRYAHDRNLLWYNRLKNRPTAEWILWDTGTHPLVTLENFLRADAATSLSAYDLVGQAERFLLFRRRPVAK